MDVARASVPRRVTVLVLAGLGLAASCGDGSSSPSPDGPPNVVVIVMDTTRADRCSVTGYHRETTPRLAELAREGTVYRDCWTPSPWTGPAHASLFTGLRPAHHGFTNTQMRIGDEHVLLAEHLRQAGWSTGCWSENTWVAPTTGLTQGFRRYDNPGARLRDEHSGAALNHAPALEWALEEHARERRFFLFVNDMEPHAPYAPAESFRERFAPGLDPETVAAAAFGFPDFIRFSVGAMPVEDGLVAAASDLYDAEIAWLDDEIGKLLDRLREAGALDNTLVIVAGDHGEGLGEHGLMGHQFSVHRNALHVPLVVRYPGVVPAGRMVDDVVRLEDVFPTVLELCGVPVPAGLDGQSLLGPLEGRVARATYDLPTRTLEAARRAAPDQDLRAFEVDLASAYDGRHHLIRATDGREWLFDVREDPLEARNLSRTEREVADRLRALLDE